MRKQILLKGLLPTLVLFSSQAAALPFQSIDPRSLSMGGTGVSSGTSANAGFMNPALLSVAGDDEDFSLELPILGARLSDPDELMDEIDNYQDNSLEANLTNAVNAFNTAVLSANHANIASASGDVASAADAMLTQLQKFTNKPITGEGFGGVVVGIPSKKVGASLMLNGYVVGSGLVDFTAADQALVQGIIDDANSTAGSTGITDPTFDDLANNPAVVDQVTGAEDVVDKLTSALLGRGAIISEIGISLSREFEIGGHDVALGVTPKYITVDTFDYRLDVNSAEFDFDDGKKDYSDFNFDFGAAKDFGNGWKAGAVIKNLLAEDYETVFGNVIKIEPQVRIGASKSNDWLTLAADIDLVENEPAGFESKTQYLGLGAEADLWGWLQLRGGYRHNLSDSDTSVTSLGFGVSPFGVHWDLALAFNSDEVAFSTQFGFRF